MTAKHELPTRVLLAHGDGTPIIAAQMSTRVIIVAPTMRAGRDCATALDIAPVAIVTPRSPHAARGITADKVYIDKGVVETGQLMAAVITCMATSRDREIIRA